MFTNTDEQMSSLRQLCRQYGVARLDLFGSATSDEFDPERSDLDFLVTFTAQGWQGAFDRFFGLKAALEDVFGRPVDLVQEKAVTNHIFRRGIDQTRKALYAA
jgi:predicted nucleotidyltransferase